MGLGWQASQLSLDLEPHYMLIVTQQQAKWHTHKQQVLRSIIKGGKVGGSPIPGNLCPSPQIVGIILPLIAYEITQPIKTDHAIFQGCSCLLRWPMLCTWSVLLSKETHFLNITLALTDFFLQWDIKNLSLIKSWNHMCDLSWTTTGFGRVQVPIWVTCFHSQGNVGKRIKGPFRQLLPITPQVVGHGFLWLRPSSVSCLGSVMSSSQQFLPLYFCTGIQLPPSHFGGFSKIWFKGKSHESTLVCHIL